MLAKLVPSAASFRRFGIWRRADTGDVGSRTLPSIESHIKNRMFFLFGFGGGAGGGGAGGAGGGRGFAFSPETQPFSLVAGVAADLRWQDKLAAPLRVYVQLAHPAVFEHCSQQSAGDEVKVLFSTAQFLLHGWHVLVVVWQESCDACRSVVGMAIDTANTHATDNILALEKRLFS